MRNKQFLLLLALSILALCPQTALGDEIIVDNASAVWDLTLDDATDVDHLVGDPGVFVTKYADTFSYFTLENATSIGRLFGEPGVFVTKYADAFVYHLLEDAVDVQHLVGEPGVMVTKYADAFRYEDLVEPFDSCRWDINEDGITNYLDAAYIGIHYGETSTEPYPRYDINEDGVVNYLDAAYIGIHYGEVTH
jgi:hypothetical protein